MESESETGEMENHMKANGKKTSKKGTWPFSSHESQLKSKRYGVYIWGDKSIYEGFNKNNKKHGKGKETWANGTFF